MCNYLLLVVFYQLEPSNSPRMASMAKSPAEA
jgi:hypothetical protein